MRSNWKRLTFTLGILAIALPSGLAAQGRTPEDAEAALNETMTELTERLDLSDDQAIRIRSILGEQNARGRAMMEEARASGEGRAAMGGMRDRMREIRMKTQEEVKAVLDEKQQGEYEKYLAERPARGRGGDRAPAPGRGNT